MYLAHNICIPLHHTQCHYSRPFALSCSWWASLLSCALATTFEPNEHKNDSDKDGWQNWQPPTMQLPRHRDTCMQPMPITRLPTRHRLTSRGVPVASKLDEKKKKREQWGRDKKGELLMALLSTGIKKLFGTAVMPRRLDLQLLRFLAELPFRS